MARLSGRIQAFVGQAQHAVRPALSAASRSSRGIEPKGTRWGRWAVDLSRQFNDGPRKIRPDEMATVVTQPAALGYRGMARQRRPRNPIGYFVICGVATALAILAVPAADRALGFLASF
jgi:hypothetical protein